MRRLTKLVVLVSVVVAATPSAASAAVVGRIDNSDNIAIRAVVGEENEVTITLASGGATYTFHDAGAQLLAGDDCTQVDPNTATCNARPGDRVLVTLRDENDTASVDVPQITSICGGLGVDTLTGGQGRDIMWGEEGDDILAGGAGIDSLDGSADCDGATYRDPDGDDTMEGGEGGDLLTGASGNDTLRGGGGSDKLLSYGGGDTINGGADGDLIVGYAGNDHLFGDDGDDLIQGGAGNDVEEGGAGNDDLGITARIFGDELDDQGDDVQSGGDGDDTLNGGPGDRWPHLEVAIAPEPPQAAVNGADVMIGGAGRDTATYVHRSTAVSMSANGQRDDGARGEGDSIDPDVERLVGGDGDDTLLGTNGPDDMDGGGGRDSLDAGGGNDTLAGGAVDGSADTVLGGTGDDAITGDAGDDGLLGGLGNDVVDGGGGNDTVFGEGGDDKLSGGPGTDSVDGGSGADELKGAVSPLVGSDGGDTLRGGSGPDALDGGPGDDTLAGGSGSDRFAGGDGADTADYSASGRQLSMSLDAVANDGASGEGDDLMADVEGVIGGRGRDTIVGADSNNTIDGAGSQDYVDGAGGTDVLSGGNASDVIRSSDGSPDEVDCGPGGSDFAIDDGNDILRRCERGAQPGAAPDRRSVAVDPGPGGALFAPPGIRRTAPLVDAVPLPFGTRVLAAERVALRARGRRTARATGAFRLRRAPRARVVLVLAQPAGCRGPSGGPSATTLDVRTRGGYSTQARGLVASGRGRWVTVEECRRSSVRVLSGRVRVRKRGRSVTLTRGRTTSVTTGAP